MSKTKIILIVITVLFAALFVYHALLVWFTQDDAYISYRYVKNFLNGEGLVFNSGERVEGYTNFFLIIIMIFFGRLGLDYIVISKIIGIGSGIGLLVLTTLWLYRLFKGRPPLTITIAALWLLVTNGVMAYWSVSGLETLLFTVLVFWGLYLVANKNLLFVPIIAIATLTRPEGGLVFVLILLYLLLVGRHRIIELVKLFLFYAILVLPQFVFRLYYYHEILPNPFYAKTGWSADYFMSGVKYVWLFMQQYGFYGALVLLPLVFYKKLPKQMHLLLIVVYGYMIYILMVGGDVLHGDRFFIPILAPLYLLLAMTVYKLAEIIFRKKRIFISAVPLVILLGAGAVEFKIPEDWIQKVRHSELLLVDKILKRVAYIKADGAQEATIACTTIGALSYNLDGCVIDMLGLTDSTIAKHPETITEIASTWKERNYNVPYIMKRNPDIIMFSTGIKPSAPAEKALFLSSKFRNGYYPVYRQEGRHLATFYKRKVGYTGGDTYLHDPAFVDAYSASYNHILRNEYRQALTEALRSIDAAPPGFYLPYVLAGNILLELQRPLEAVEYFKRSFEISGGYDLHAADMLRRYYELGKDTAQANYYQRIIAEKNKFNWSD